MERIFIEVEYEEFSVEFKESNGWYEGNVYPIDRWKHLPTGKEGWSYQSKTESSKNYEELNEDCRIMFAFAFVWRGVWEGRLYFLDTEYWSEELKTMSALWDKIEVMLKDKIRQNDPTNTFDD